MKELRTPNASPFRSKPTFSRKFVEAFSHLFLAFYLTSALAAQLPQSFTVTVDDTQGGTVELNLTKYSMRSPNFLVRSWDTTNGYVVEHSDANPAHPARTYRGHLTENPNHLVLAVVHPDNTLQAEIHDGSGRLWAFSDVNVSTALGNGSAIPHPSATLSAGSGTSTPLGLPGALLPPIGMYIAHGVEDVPSRFYDQQGSVEKTLTWLEFQWNIQDFFNARDAKLSIELSEVIIRKEQFYTPDNGSYSQFDSALQAEWLAQGQNPRGFIHSWFPYNFSYAGGYNSSRRHYELGREAIAVNALYHEVGHSFGAEHYLYGNETMTGNKPAHSEMNTQRVLNIRQIEINQDQGILAATEYATNLHPRAYADVASTTVNTAVALQPLANDYDANGDSISIKSYTSNTVKGGSVTQSGDTLTYTPANGYVGKDLIVYEIEDSAGLYTRNLIHIEVINGGLAGHWQMEENSGSTAADNSGHGHHGSLSAGDFSTVTVSGIIGNAIQLEASQSFICDDSSLLAGADGVYPLDEDEVSNFFDPMDQDYTAALWFKLPAGTTSATLLSKNNNSGLGFSISADTTNGLNATARVWDGLEYKYASSVTAGTIHADTWYHVAMVIDRTSGKLRLFLNGTEIGVAANIPAGFFIFNGRAELRIGGKGAIIVDDTQIHTRALDSADIQQLLSPAQIPSRNPLPENYAMNLSPSLTSLSWEAGKTSYQHDIYFGTDPVAVANATTSSPEYLGRQSSTSINTSNLNLGIKYYWRVDQVDGSTIIPGSLWNFSTATSARTIEMALHLSMDEEDVQIADSIIHTYDDTAYPGQHFRALNISSTTSGINGEALSLNGSNGALRSYDDIPLVPAADGITVSFWINTASNQEDNNRIYDFGSYFFMHYNNGDLRFAFDGTTSGASYVNTNINDGQWHHIVARNDGQGLSTLYLDGSLVHSQSETIADVTQSTRTASVGSDYDGTGRHLEASIDEFTVWTRTLSSSEISSIHTEGLAGNGVLDLPFLVKTSFEASEGFNTFSSDGVRTLTTTTDNLGNIWTNSGDAHIWNRTDIPPDGIQVITLGNNESELGRCDLEIPGSSHGINTVSFNYASYSGSTNATFRLLYNSGSGWVEAWSTQIIGDSPKYGQKPWPSVELALNIPGDVDLRFETEGTKGAKFDNVKVTGLTSNTPPLAVDDSAIATGSNPLSISLLGNDSDPDGDSISLVSIGSALNGSLVNNGGGNLTYTADSDFYGTETISYIIQDSNGAQAQAQLIINVYITGYAPINAVADSYSITSATTGSADVLANDITDNRVTASIAGFANSFLHYSAGTTTTPPNPNSVEGGSWTLSETEDSDVSTGSVTGSASANDNGSGLDAWIVRDETQSSGDFIQYSRQLSPEQKGLADTSAWSLRCKLRMIDDYGDSQSVILQYGNGNRRFLLFFDLNSTGDLVINAIGSGGNAYTVTENGTGSTEFHDIEILYSPTDSTAAILVDGQRIDTGNWTGQSHSFTGVQWGTGSSGGQGSAAFHSVDFDVFVDTLDLDSGITLSHDGAVVNHTALTGFDALVDGENFSDSITYLVLDDQGGRNTTELTVDINGIDDTPTLTGFSVNLAENTAPGSTVGSVSVSDPDAGDNASFAITDGNDANMFIIDSAGVITTRSLADFETRPSYTLSVTVTDSTGLQDTAAVNIAIDDLPESVPQWRKSSHLWYTFSGNQIWDNGYLNSWSVVNGSGSSESLNGANFLHDHAGETSATTLDGTNATIAGVIPAWNTLNEADWTLEARIKFIAIPNGFGFWIGTGTDRIFIKVNEDGTRSDANRFSATHNNIDGEFHTFRITHDSLNGLYHVWRDGILLTAAAGVAYDYADVTDERMLFGDTTSGSFGDGFTVEFESIAFDPTGAYPPVAPDSDSDGIDDTWEMTHFADLSNDAHSDHDNDGVTLLGEYLSGTDPTDRNSKLSFNCDHSQLANSLEVNISDSSRLRNYTLMYSPNLGASANWSAVPGFIDMNGSDGQLQLSLPNPSVGFYRIEASLP